MPGYLFDTNVWVAAIFPTHPFHSQSRKALLAATTATPAVFCRSTQQSFLRLTSTPALIKAYGADGLTNRDALVALEALLALPQVCECAEPSGTVAPLPTPQREVDDLRRGSGTERKPVPHPVGNHQRLGTAIPLPARVIDWTGVKAGPIPKHHRAEPESFVHHELPSVRMPGQG